MADIIAVNQRNKTSTNMAHIYISSTRQHFSDAVSSKIDRYTDHIKFKYTYIAIRFCKGKSDFYEQCCNQNTGTVTWNFISHDCLLYVILCVFKYIKPAIAYNYVQYLSTSVSYSTGAFTSPWKQDYQHYTYWVKQTNSNSAHCSYFKGVKATLLLNAE